MCGIAGIYNSKKLEDSHFSKIENILSILKHRGPNSNGFFKNENTILCHTRLAIIDTTDAANQPFYDSSGRYLIILNGEIFNFKELKQNLQKNGITFYTQSDTEVLLNLYISEGEKCLPLLNGFFSFCVYDLKENSLFVATDRYGIKPLYYSFNNNNFIFSSELKAITAFEEKNKIDKISLKTYLHLNYIPQPYSILEEVFKLEPGKYLTIKNNVCTKNVYYHTEKKVSNEITTITKNVKDELKNLLEDAVKLRLISDVPLGCFLSGGIDSSIIAALASKHQQNLKTFSVEFKNQPYFNETEFAIAVSKMHNTNHTVITINNNTITQIFQEVLNCLDEPFADSSAIAVYALCKEVKKHVTVALSGDGADELFGGYLKHQAEYRARNPLLIEKTIALLLPFIKHFPQSRNNTFTNKIRQLTKFASSLHLSNEERYWQWAGNNYPQNNLLNTNYYNFKSENLIFEERKKAYTSAISRNNNLNGVLLADQQMVLPGDMLTKVDRMSMANSLEVRTPYLDYRLVDFINSLPASLKINRRNRKILLVETFKEILPQTIYTRPKKGFEIPLHYWLTNELKEQIEFDWLNLKDIKNEDIFNIHEIEKLKQKLFSSNPENSTALVWAIIVFRNWHKKNCT